MVVSKLLQYLNWVTNDCCNDQEQKIVQRYVPIEGKSCEFIFLVFLQMRGNKWNLSKANGEKTIEYILFYITYRVQIVVR